MRHVAITLGLVFLAGLAGCTSTRWGFVKNNERPAGPGGTGDAPSVAQVVEWMNVNAGYIRTLRSDELEVTCSMGQGLATQTTSLRGKMATEKLADKPSNFRLNASVLGSPVVDLGSNSEEFWYWISKANPPYQVYCSYKDLKEGRVRQMPFPFQPEWVMECMGLGPYGPAEKYTFENGKDTLKLVEKTTSAKGEAVRKVIVLKSRQVKAPAPQVTDYLLLDDATGKEICSAHISEVQLIQVDSRTSAIIPKRMELRWPDEKLKLALRLDGVVLNPPLTGQMFMRPTGGGIQSFNLARMQIDNSPPPQAYSGVDTKIRPVQGLAP